MCFPLAAALKPQTHRQNSDETATLKEFCGCIIALDARRWKGFNGTKRASLRFKPVTSNQKKVWRLPFAVPFTILPVCSGLYTHSSAALILLVLLSHLLRYLLRAFGFHLFRGLLSLSRVCFKHPTGDVYGDIAMLCHALRTREPCSVLQFQR